MPAYTFIFLGTYTVSVFLLQWWQQNNVIPYATIVICCLVLLRYSKRIYTMILCVLLGVSTAFLIVNVHTHTSTGMDIEAHADGNTHVVIGTIVAEPDRRPMQIKYTIAASHIKNMSGVIKNTQGRILITDRRMWPTFSYGNTVQVRGTLEKPGVIDSTFFYDKYLSRYNIYSVMYQASIRSYEHPSLGITSLYSSTQNTFYKNLYALKETFESQINKIYNEPHASFMAGLLTGSRKGIPSKLMEDFNTTGLTHIIAISGYNITIIITVISGALFWLPLKWRFIPSVVAIICFTIFVGASAAVVRAAIMGILGLIALQIGRITYARLIVAWTLCMMLAYNPKLLWYDAGFQLSFLAVIGLMEISPMISRYFSWCTKKLAIQEGLLMTMSAQISAVPIIILLFGRLSLIAPIANVLIAPAIPLAMLFGFCGVMISFVIFPLGQLICYLGFACLEWILLVATILAKAPYASIDTGNIHTMYIILYYIVLITFVYLYNTTTDTKKAASVVCDE